MNGLEAGTRHREDTMRAHSKAIERVLTAIRPRLTEGVSLPEMADIAFMARHHFQRVFREVSGTTPGRFLCALRLDAAKRLLLETDMSVTDVCFEVGYNSLGTFSRRFSELVGLSPRQFQELASVGPQEAPDGIAKRARRRGAPASVRGIVGRVRRPNGFDGSVFVGLFPSAIPESRPLSCTILTDESSFRLAPVADGRYHLFAVGLDGTMDARDYLLCDGALRGSNAGGVVELEGGRGTADAEIRLRPPRESDPPILPVLPLLIRERNARNARLVVEPPASRPS